MSLPPDSSAPRARLLIVDDEANQLTMLERILSRAGYAVTTASQGQRALDLLESSGFDLMLTDQRMPEMDGLQLLERAVALHPGLPVVLMTAYGSVSSAVDAMKRGAADYLTKPFQGEELLLVLDKVLERRRLEGEVASLRSVLRDRHRLGGLLGQSGPMQELFTLIERIAVADVPVLIRGESGTGKELAARAIHALGKHPEGPFVALNCAAVPEHLLESEFFGHEKGAFTGADRSHPGRFEQAHGGTLLLDEIGAMRVDLQAKLLRVLQEGEVQRLGGRESRKVNVRILASTCQDLERAITRNQFREDLYYRLNVVPVQLSPLRERQEDIPLLVEHFLTRACQRLDHPTPVMDAPVLDRLQTYAWPGNVRELKNVVERLVILCSNQQIRAEDLPPALQAPGELTGTSATGVQLPAGGIHLGELERSLIVQALKRSRGNLGPAASLLGISYKTLQYRIRKHRIEREAPDDFTPNGAD